MEATASTCASSESFKARMEALRAPAGSEVDGEGKPLHGKIAHYIRGQRMGTGLDWTTKRRRVLTGTTESGGRIWLGFDGSGEGFWRRGRTIGGGVRGETERKVRALYGGHDVID